MLKGYWFRDESPREVYRESCGVHWVSATQDGPNDVLHPTFLLYHSCNKEVELTPSCYRYRPSEEGRPHAKVLVLTRTNCYMLVLWLPLAPFHPNTNGLGPNLGPANGSDPVPFDLGRTIRVERSTTVHDVVEEKEDKTKRKATRSSLSGCPGTTLHCYPGYPLDTHWRVQV